MAILEHRFNIKGAQVDYALNGEEAVKIIKDDLKNYPRLPERRHRAGFDPEAVPCTYPLILMDCNMPFMDGFECTQLIR